MESNNLYSKVVFATTSRWKLEQAYRFLKPFNIEPIAPPKFNRPKDELFVRTPGGDSQYAVEIQAASIEEVCSFKAESAAANLEQPILVEDIGIAIHALNGFPGPYTKYAVVTLGVSGFLRLMQGVDDRTAEMISVAGYCEPGGKPITFTGSLSGTLIQQEQIDPDNQWKDVLLYSIFCHKGSSLSLAQIQPEELMSQSSFPMRVSLERFANWYHTEHSRM